ncbi:class II aldolase and Adducin N-terminal domain-containing protein [Nemania sp. FL0916]|nr:class II aldolase and Adducin N-terminal domain-containing protein [Nemania sp. FL0916]
MAAANNMTGLFATFIHGLHILHNNGVLDAYGHLSVRSTRSDPSPTFYMSRNMAPALVASPADIVEYRISDAEAVDKDAPNGFIERYIHSELYKRFSDVNAVVHSHSPAVVPYTVVTDDVALRPVLHMAGFLGEHVPVFDIAKYYTADDVQDLLVRNVRLGAALAAEFSSSSTTNPNTTATSTPITTTASSNNSSSSSPDYSTVLMRGHGFTLWAADIKAAVFQAVYAQTNAQAQSQALALSRAATGVAGQGQGQDGSGGIAYLTPQQARDTADTMAGTVQRPWDLWVREVKVAPLYVNVLDL